MVTCCALKEFHSLVPPLQPDPLLALLLFHQTTLPHPLRQVLQVGQYLTKVITIMVFLILTVPTSESFER